MSDKSAAWRVFQAALQRKLRNEPIETFMTWPSIKATMVIDSEIPMIAWERNLLGKAAEGKTPQEVHQMYSAHVIAERVQNDYGSVIEFGGGYGHLASILVELCRDYTIYDLPELNQIQQYWLGQQGVNGVQLVNDMRKLPKLCDTIIGMYSLTETPMRTRNAFLARVQARNIVLAMTAVYEDVNNERWADETFRDWSAYERWYHPLNRGIQFVFAKR